MPTLSAFPFPLSSLQNLLFSTGFSRLPDNTSLQGIKWDGEACLASIWKQGICTSSTTFATTIFSHSIMWITQGKEYQRRNRGHYTWLRNAQVCREEEELLAGVQVQLGQALLVAEVGDNPSCRPTLVVLFSGTHFPSCISLCLLPGWLEKSKVGGQKQNLNQKEVSQAPKLH